MDKNVLAVCVCGDEGWLGHHFFVIDMNAFLKKIIIYCKKIMLLTLMSIEALAVFKTRGWVLLG